MVTHVIVSWGVGGSILTWVSPHRGFYGQKAGDYENWNGKISPGTKTLDCQLEEEGRVFGSLRTGSLGSKAFYRLPHCATDPKRQVCKNRMILQGSWRRLQGLCRSGFLFRFPARFGFWCHHQLVGWLKGDSSSVTRWVHPSVETFTAQAQKLASKILEKPRTMPIMVIEEKGHRMVKHLNEKAMFPLQGQ